MKSNILHIVPFIAQRGNYMILLSLRFYVKSKLANVQSQNQPFEKNLQPVNLEIYDFLHFLKTEIYLINKIQSP